MTFTEVDHQESLLCYRFVATVRHLDFVQGFELLIGNELTNQTHFSYFLMSFDWHHKFSLILPQMFCFHNHVQDFNSSINFPIDPV